MAAGADAETDGVLPLDLPPCTTVDVAKVAVDMPHPHLDRLFDYTVPDKLAADAVPGARIRVRFSGQLRDAWLIDYGQADPAVAPAPIHGVVSNQSIMTAAYRQFLQAIAEHYAGTFSDVARLAVPARHAAVENTEPKPWPEPKEQPEPELLPCFPGGGGYLDSLAGGGSPRAAWLMPSRFDAVGDLTSGVVEAVAAVLKSGRTALVVVPTARELNHVATKFHDAFGKSAVAQLSADMGRSARYRHYLAASRGHARIVVGTRSAALANLPDVGLVVVVDDGHDGHRELRAPYPHSREIAVLRATHSGAGLLFASHARSTEVQAFIERQWLREIRLTPADSRRLTAPVRVTGDDPSREPTAAKLRLPTGAFRFLRDCLARGPVLVQVPRSGRASGLQCDRCRNRAQCPKCSGTLRSRSGIECSYCGFEPPRWECPHCHATSLRAPVVGATRTAEELARAFPGTMAINSSADKIRDTVPDTSAIVVATPGGEPRAENGYAGVLLLDTLVMLSRTDLRVNEESLRRWANAMALCRSGDAMGSVLAVGETQHPALQALIRNDIPAFVSRELSERAATGLPPAARVVRIGGDTEAVQHFLDNDRFDGVDIIGPSPVEAGPDPQSVVLLRTPLSRGRDLTRMVKHAAAVRSARKEGGKLYIQTDPEVME